MIDISKIQSSSLTPGIQDLGALPDIVSTFNGTIPAKGTLTTTIPIPFPNSKVMSLIKVNISGGKAGAFWFPVIAGLTILDYNPAISSNYGILAYVTGSGSGRVLNLVFVNDLNNATQALPNLTITVRAHLYNFAW
jgi:hypothetical protein